MTMTSSRTESWASAVLSGFGSLTDNETNLLAEMAADNGFRTLSNKMRLAQGIQVWQLPVSHCHLLVRNKVVQLSLVLGRSLGTVQQDGSLFCSRLGARIDPHCSADACQDNH